MNKHTPGPWEWSGEFIYAGRAWPDPVLWIKDPDDEPELGCGWADRALIVSAPLLLEALRDVMHFREGIEAKEFDIGSPALARVFDQATVALAAAELAPWISPSRETP